MSVEEILESFLSGCVIFLIVIVAVAVLANKISGGKRSVQYITCSILDIFAGVFAATWAHELMDTKYLSDEKESILMFIKWFGIMISIIGIVGVFRGWYVSQKENEKANSSAEARRFQYQDVPQWRREEMIKYGNAVTVDKSGFAMHCPKCGTHQSTTRQTCYQCGVLFVDKPKEQERYCRSCGSQIKGDNVFCGKCGQRQG